MAGTADVSRRSFLVTTGSAATGALVALHTPRVLAQAPFDLVVRGATLLDGTGAPPFTTDLGVVGDRIAALGRIAAEQGRRAIDAPGLHLAPGFIDIHTHSDGDILLYPTADSRVRQGVTTEITGNCGGSAAPVAGADTEGVRREWRESGIEASWTTVATYFEVLERAGLSVNHAMLLGQGTLRQNAVGLADRPLTRDELAAVCREVEIGMDEGAFGLSTGLEYVPGRYTPAEEIVAMARVVARHGGLYASHIRNEEIAVLEAVDEAIEVGRRTGCRVEISHLKATGRGNWSKQRAALDLIESARRSGVAILADAYPYTAYSTGLTILLPAEMLEGGTSALLKRLADPADRSRTRAHLERQIRQDPGDPSQIVIARIRAEGERALIGRTLAEIATDWTVDPGEAVLRLIEMERGNVPFIGHGMSPENVEMVLGHPLVMVGSDGQSMAPVGRAAESRPHPRSYGAFARILAHYRRERKVFDLPAAVRKMTSMPADQVGLADRGRIAVGKRADLVLFDAAAVKDEATFDSPHRFASGIPYVVVNGTLVVDGGQHTGAKPGRVLRRA